MIKQNVYRSIACAGWNIFISNLKALKKNQILTIRSKVYFYVGYVKLFLQPHLPPYRSITVSVNIRYGTGVWWVVLIGVTINGFTSSPGVLLRRCTHVRFSSQPLILNQINWKKYIIIVNCRMISYWTKYHILLFVFLNYTSLGRWTSQIVLLY